MMGTTFENDAAKDAGINSFKGIANRKLATLMSKRRGIIQNMKYEMERFEKNDKEIIGVTHALKVMEGQ